MWHHEYSKFSSSFLIFLSLQFILVGTDASFFNRREWSFTIEDDIYIRYQCFRDVEEFKAGIQKRQPHKIDIGAVFTALPSKHGELDADKFKTVERELVFDIDMTDYDDIRTCCDGANICLKCWPFMTMAMKVVDRSVREDFGFKNLVWIYSGMYASCFFNTFHTFHTFLLVLELICVLM